MDSESCDETEEGGNLFTWEPFPPKAKMEDKGSNAAERIQVWKDRKENLWTNVMNSKDWSMSPNIVRGSREVLDKIDGVGEEKEGSKREESNL